MTKRRLGRCVVLLVLALFLVAGTAYAAEKRLIVKDSNSKETFTVTDEGHLWSVQGDFGAEVTSARATRAFNLINDAAYGRFWRIHEEWPPGFDLIHSLPADPDTMKSWYNIFAGPYPAGSGNEHVFGIMDRTGGIDEVRFSISDDGYVGIGLGSTMATHLLELNGGAYCDGGAWVTGSSRELKKEIEEISYQDALETTMKLKPVTYRYKKTPAEKHVGFIAEDVPEMVAVNSRKGLETMDFVAVLTKIVQEQQKAIAHLKLEVEALKATKVAAK